MTVLAPHAAGQASQTLECEVENVVAKRVQLVLG